MKHLFDIEFPPRRILFIMTLVCLALLTGTYFRSDTAIPIRTAIGYIVVPLQTAMNQFGQKTSGMIDKRIAMDELLTENEQLKIQNQELRQELSLTQKDKNELIALRKLLEIKESYSDYDMVGASIISKTSTNWTNRFTIDKGLDFGISENMVVVSGKGLVGIVTAVGANYATVTTIMDDSMNVSAMSLSTKANCIIRGDATLSDDHMLAIRYLNKDDSIGEGDAIVTSNISDFYLPDILIGYATDVSLESNKLTKAGHLIPAVDFDSLEDVCVIRTLKQSGK